MWLQYKNYLCKLTSPRVIRLVQPRRQHQSHSSDVSLLLKNLNCIYINAITCSSGKYKPALSCIPIVHVGFNVKWWFTIVPYCNIWLISVWSPLCSQFYERNEEKWDTNLSKLASYSQNISISLPNTNTIQKHQLQPETFSAFH